jgi:tetratricopeptide (TPR) repeat protein
MATKAEHTTSLRRIFLAWALCGAAWPALGAPNETRSEGASSAPGAARRQDDDERELAFARAEADRQRRRGDPRAETGLRRLLSDDEDDWESRALWARWLADQTRWEEALVNGERALEAAPPDAREARAALGRTLLEVHIALAQLAPARALLTKLDSVFQPASDARDAWQLGQLARLAGDRELAQRHFASGVQDGAEAWDRRLARARCARALGDLSAASQALVEADRLAQAAGGAEPDVLAELAAVYFEADGELEHARANSRQPGELYRASLELNKAHEPTLLGLFELGRFNWNRQSTPAQEYLERALAAAPNSVRALLAGAWADVADGKLPVARERLRRLEALAPNARGVRTLAAALAWVEHRREECSALLAALAAEDPSDSAPERDVGRHLSELYRFGEAVDFLRRAVKRDERDHVAWMELGRALANSGDEKGGLEALQRSEREARGRQNAWRHNTRLVLERMQTKFVTESGGGELRYAWSPEAAEVLRTYWMPFYEGARTELSARYAFTPGPVVIEVFDRFQDFSVRSTGFEGFPALGVCFGPVVTAVAPHSEMRGRFSWARTAFHEFTHVIHLGLSHNRCPRWITEGLATWEEENKHPAWSRNMRRDLLDAFHNGDLIAVRELNRAFRSSRIIFGYYQSGLLCRMLIEERGFAPMIALLEAFDRGADIDGAVKEVFDTTPEALDRQFHAWVDARLQGLALEPRWSPQVIVRKRMKLKDQPPPDAAARTQWGEDWTTVAWGYHQQTRRVDAEQALRRLDGAQIEPPRAAFLRGEMALARGDEKAAREHYERGLAKGGEDYRARMALGKLAQRERENERALEQFLAAERAFPGYDEPGFSAELHLAAVHQAMENEEQQIEALERRLAWTSDDYENTVRVGRWHADKGRHERAAALFERANEIDPFRRALHVAWGKALRECGRHEEALREFRVAAVVPPALDIESPDPPSDEERAELLGAQALEFARLGKADEAREAANEALALDAGQADAESALELLRTKGS